MRYFKALVWKWCFLSLACAFYLIQRILFVPQNLKMRRNCVRKQQNFIQSYLCLFLSLCYYLLVNLETIVIVFWVNLCGFESLKHGIRSQLYILKFMTESTSQTSLKLISNSKKESKPSLLGDVGKLIRRGCWGIVTVLAHQIPEVFSCSVASTSQPRTNFKMNI